MLESNMEHWSDQGIVLSARPHGEGGAVVALLTENNGRHAGYVHGAQSSKKRAILEPGSMVSVEWSSRVADNLGSYKLEQIQGLPAGIMDDPLKLGALMAACSLCDAALPEREGHPGLYYGFRALIDILSSEDIPHTLPPDASAFAKATADETHLPPSLSPISSKEGEAAKIFPDGGEGGGSKGGRRGGSSIWGPSYVIWEIALLKELGFGLDFTQCAGGGDPETLAYISPKSGRAVSEAAAAPYKEKLLPMPLFLRPSPPNPPASGGEARLVRRSSQSEGGSAGGEQKGAEQDVLLGLQMTGHFLEHWVFAHHTKGVPEPRLRFEERFGKSLSNHIETSLRA